MKLYLILGVVNYYARTRKANYNCKRIYFFLL